MREFVNNNGEVLFFFLNSPVSCYERDHQHENEVNKTPNATIKRFLWLSNGWCGHVAANNNDKIVYNDQPYLKEPIQDNKNFGLDDWVCLWSCLKHCYLLCLFIEILCMLWVV